MAQSKSLNSATVAEVVRYMIAARLFQLKRKVERRKTRLNSIARISELNWVIAEIDAATKESR